MRDNATSLLLVLWLAAASQLVRGQSCNTFSTTGVVGTVFVTAINVSGTTNGFIRRASGEIVTFLVPGSSITQPYSINSAGAVTGVYFAGNSHFHGFVRDASGAITAFDVPGAINTGPTSINAIGQIVGSYSSSTESSGFERAVDGTFTTLTTSSGFNSAQAINDEGFIIGQAGTSAFVRNPAGLITIAKPIPGYQTYPVAINSGGTIAGFYGNAPGYVSFTRSPDSPTEFFQVNGNSTTVTGINAAGATTGYYLDPVSGHLQTFVRAADGNFTLLSCPGFTSTQASGINSNGTVAGTVELCTRSCRSFGFVYSPKN